MKKKTVLVSLLTILLVTLTLSKTYLTKPIKETKGV